MAGSNAHALCMSACSRRGDQHGRWGNLMNSIDADAFLNDILSTVKAIAVVGASDKESQPSHGVFGFLVAQGYHVIGRHQHGGYFPQLRSCRGSSR